jgi:xylan 1,4-beta-xylosidase
MIITNPILPGFHPDPSICRAGDDYYIATSTFQWWPAVRLHHSRDLVHFRPIGYAVTRVSQLNMLGNEDNSGVWAPCLSYQDGLFYLIYTDAKSWTGAYKDTHNYLITAPSIEGPWSERIYLNSSGFDASLFHGEDGKKYLLNMQWDHRVGVHPFSGILMQEFDAEQKRLVGPRKVIFRGTEHRLVEGPHLYKKDGYYYLLTAEGGTTWDHVETVARSRNLWGPYEVMPHNPLITSKYDPTLPLQRAGHGSLVETQNKEWYFVHLTGRPVMPERRCILGRETAIQAITWPEGEWPHLSHGTNTPALEVKAPELPPHPFAIDSKTTYFHDDFDAPLLHPDFNTLRAPYDESWLSLCERPGFLRLAGRESLYSKFEQSLVARRLTHLTTVVTTELEFEPDCFQQMAGLIFYYDCIDYHYLHITHGERGRCLRLLTCEAGNQLDYAGSQGGLVELPLQPGPVTLRGVLNFGELQFYYREGEGEYTRIGPVLDATVLSDEYKVEVKFTGAFAGLCVQDLSGRRLHADFDSFTMESPSS